MSVLTAGCTWAVSAESARLIRWLCPPTQMNSRPDHWTMPPDSAGSHSRTILFWHHLGSCPVCSGAESEKASEVKNDGRVTYASGKS